MSEQVEVRVRRGGKTIATVLRPLRALGGCPAVTFKGRLWPLINGAIELGIDGEPPCSPPETEVPAPPRGRTIQSSGWDGPLPNDLAEDAVQCFEDPIAAEPPFARLLIDAGPGTGKTHAACARVASLINGGIPPTRIYLVSFTRTAVVEIRNRISKALADPADAPGIRVVTLDSFAWSIQSGFINGAKLDAGFEENIKETCRLVRNDLDVRADLERIEHLIVDEAQDIVGARADLVLEIIDALSPTCGVSVFSDRAQAIYEFSEDEDEAKTVSLLDQLRMKGFKLRELTSVHRTRDRNLLSIFTDLRSDILRRGSPDLAKHVRSEIKRLAHEDAGLLSALDLAAVPDGALVLARNRSDILSASSRAGLCPHRLRQSGLPTSVRQWVGEMFWDFAERRIIRNEFEHRWLDRKIVAPIEMDDAWGRCVEVAGDSAKVVDLHRLRAALSKAGPPMMFCSPEFGTVGPILGTIHASKGRESSLVHLYLPARVTAKDNDEEARVMFVGATRPRERLVVGLADHQISSYENGRIWRRGKRNVLIEVGRMGDIDPSGLVGRSTFKRQSDALDAQDAWVSAPRRSRMVIRAEEGMMPAFSLIDGEQRLAGMSQGFSWDIRRIGRAIGRRICWMGQVRSMGIRTMAVAPDSSQLEHMLEPWRSSGFLFCPLIYSQSNVPMGHR
ncbi:UvrD-helicase domain-containing protein [Stenotrophomonas bentonitica]